MLCIRLGEFIVPLCYCYLMVINCYLFVPVYRRINNLFLKLILYEVNSYSISFLVLELFYGCTRLKLGKYKSGGKWIGESHNYYHILMGTMNELTKTFISRHNKTCWSCQTFNVTLANIFHVLCSTKLSETTP